MKLPFSFYLLVVLGLICGFGLLLWLYSMVTLHEAMAESNSPMVGGAPFVCALFIFVFAWLSYILLASAATIKRTTEGRPRVRILMPALWFALAMSTLGLVYYHGVSYLCPPPKPVNVG